MRRLAVIGTIIAGLIAGTGPAGTPASAASGAPAGTAVSTGAAMGGTTTAATAGARARVKAVVTSLSGQPILIARGIIRCTSYRSNDGTCTWNWTELETHRYQRTVRVKRAGLAVLFFGSDHRFRMRVYVNNVKMHDRKAIWSDDDNNGSGIWFRGFVIYGPGAINLI